MQRLATTAVSSCNDLKTPHDEGISPVKFLRFNGRSSWQEYWRTVRFPLVFIPLVTTVVFAVFTMQTLAWSFLAILVIPQIGVLAALVLSPFWLAVTVRRLHDTGRSAKWMTIYVIILLGWAGIGVLVVALARIDYANIAGSSTLGAALVGAILSLVWAIASLAGLVTLFVLCTYRGTVGPNRYGLDPLVQESGHSTNEDAPTAQSPSDQEYCVQCGTRLPRGSRFCMACGTSIQ